jgi:hypothetical protein
VHRIKLIYLNFLLTNICISVDNEYTSSLILFKPCNFDKLDMMFTLTILTSLSQACSVIVSCTECQQSSNPKTSPEQRK